MPGLSQAQTKHVKDPKLRTAIQAWLDYDDRTSLPLLSELAKDGNENARLLLGQINVRPGDISPYLRSLDIKERNALIRAPGGLSGKSWFRYVKKNKELAEAFLAVGFTGTRRDAISTLFKYGEFGQGIKELKSVINQGDFHTLFKDFYKFELPPRYLSDLYFMAGYADTKNLDRKARKARLAVIEKLETSIELGDIHGYLYFSHAPNYLKHSAKFKTQILIGQTIQNGGFLYKFEEFAKSYNLNGDELDREKAIVESRAAVEETYRLIINSDEFIPMIRVCEKHCSNDVEQCIRFTFSYLGYGNYREIQSPLERLISPTEFNNSLRFEAELTAAASWHPGHNKNLQYSPKQMPMCIQKYKQLK